MFGIKMCLNITNVCIPVFVHMFECDMSCTHVTYSHAFCLGGCVSARVGTLRCVLCVTGEIRVCVCGGVLE